MASLDTLGNTLSAGAGKVLQVVQATVTDHVASSITSATHATSQITLMEVSDATTGVITTG